MAAPQQIEQVRLPSVCTCFSARRAVNISVACFWPPAFYGIQENEGNVQALKKPARSPSLGNMAYCAKIP